MPWLRAELRCGYEGEPNATRPDGQPRLPWEHLLPTDKILSAGDVYPAWMQVGLPVQEAILRTSAARIVIPASTAFPYADALLAAVAGEVEVLRERYKNRFGTVLPWGFHGPRRLLSFREIKAAGYEVDQEWPGAVWQALAEANAAAVPIYIAHEKIRKRTAELVRRAVFGPRGWGIHSSTRLVPLDDEIYEIADPAAPMLQPAGLSERSLRRLEPLTPAEHQAVITMYEAIENDETLAEWCHRHEEPYAPIQRAWARAKARMLESEKR